MENLKEEIAVFLETADSPDTRDLVKLRELYKAITGKDGKCENKACIAGMLRTVRQEYHKLSKPEEVKPERKYTLKEGNHSFYPGAPAIHNNDNTTDEDIAAHIALYPHIKKLLK